MSERRTPLTVEALTHVSGGTDWAQNARGSFVMAGDHIVYTAAEGDTLAAVSGRYGVTVGQLRSWNSLAETGPLSAGQRIILYPKTIR